MKGAAAHPLSGQADLFEEAPPPGTDQPPIRPSPPWRAPTLREPQLEALLVARALLAERGDSRPPLQRLRVALYYAAGLKGPCPFGEDRQRWANIRAAQLLRAAGADDHG